MLPLIKAVPLISTVMHLAMKVYDWWNEKEPNKPEVEDRKVVRDTTKFSSSQKELIISTFSKMGPWNQIKRTEYLNEHFGLHKSVTAYRKVWKDSLAT